MYRTRIRRQTLVPLLAALIALMCALPAFAQTTGALRVVVYDDMGIPVPGADVTVSGEEGDRERQTDANGEATWGQLPPGEYDVTVLFAGYASITKKGVLIKIGSTHQEDFDLQPSDTATEIEVVAKRDAVNTEDTSSSEVLTKDFLNRIPTGRSYQAAVGLAAGVTGQGGNKNISGGASNENTYMLDGANITDPVTGTFSVNFNFDAIEQIEVLLGGYMPEYPTSLGGIVNIVTENGTNNLEFTTSVFYNNGNWRPRMDERFTADGLTLAPTGFDSEFQSLQVASKIAGPLVRDKAWFILSYQHSRSIIANTGIPQTRDYDAHYILSKLTVQPAAEHRFTALTQLDPTTIDNIDQFNPYQKAEAQGRQVQGGFLAQGTWQWFLSPDVNLETQFTTQKTFIEVNGVPCTHNEKFDYHPCEPGEIEGAIDWETPGRYGIQGAFSSVNFLQFYFDDRWRYTATSKLSLVSVQDPLGGKHDMKFGVEGNQLIWDQIQGFNGNAYFVDINEVPFDPQTLQNYYWIEISGPIKFRTTGSSWAAFAQDSWKPVSNLTINYGLRYDSFVSRNDLGEPVLTGSMFGPRLYGAWDPWGDQRTKIATGYGRFNSAGRLDTASFLSAANYGSHLYLGEIFGGGSPGYINNAANDYDTDPAKNFSTSADGLTVPRIDEIILNIEREVVEDFALKSHMTGRFTRYQYEQDETNLIFDSDGSTIIGSRISDPTQSIQRLRTPLLAKRDYFRWDLIAHKVKANRWEAQGTYSYTANIGSTVQALSGSFANDPQSQFNYGPLNTDLRHVFKAWGFWDLPTDPWTQTVGLAFEYYSGFPDERLYLAENQGGSGFSSQSLRIRPRGTYFRFNPYWSAGLRFQQTIDVRKGRLVVDLSATNVFNNRAPDDPFNNFFNANNRLLTLSRQDPLQLQAGLRYEF